MSRKKRSVADRLKSLQHDKTKASFMIAGIRAMYAGIEGKEFRCTINGHCRTLVFEFPRGYLSQDSDESHHFFVYESQAVQACITSNMDGYFGDETRSRHYDISPSLRHVVCETDQKTRSRNRDHVPVFLVIEEDNELTPVEMTKGECCISDEVLEEDGKKVPILVGGRENERFLTAWDTVDGAWPKIPSNQEIVNLILAAVRVAQKTSNPIRKHMDQSCLVTNDGRYVNMIRPTGSARLETTTKMDTSMCRSRAAEIRKAIAKMEKEIPIPHMALLINSMYSDERKDDSYQRLLYLRLWQSLVDAGEKCLSYQGDIRKDDVVVAGKRTLRELTEYRDDIAHWWTDTIDENYLADLQQTINELIHRRYFYRE